MCLSKSKHGDRCRKKEVKEVDEWEEEGGEEEEFEEEEWEEEEW